MTNEYMKIENNEKVKKTVGTFKPEVLITIDIYKNLLVALTFFSVSKYLSNSKIFDELLTISLQNWN